MVKESIRTDSITAISGGLSWFAFRYSPPPLSPPWPAWTPAHAATLIADGNFDAPLSPGNFTTYTSGQSFGPWTVTSGSVDLIGNYWQAPTLGGGSVDLAGGDAGAIRQDFTAAMGRYQVSFLLSGNPDGGNSVKNMIASLSGIDHAFTFDTTASRRTAWVMCWKPSSSSAMAHRNICNSRTSIPARPMAR